MNKLGLAHDLQETANGISAVGSELSVIPQIKGHVQPMGCGLTLDLGGLHIGLSMEALATAAKAVAEQYSYEAGNTAKLGTYSRREQEWTFQSNLAVGEINQVMKQLRAAQIREAIAQTEYQNHQAQMQQAQDIQDFLQGTELSVGNQGQCQKTTTVGFYLWMKGALQNLYSNAFQLAFTVAKKAEQALQHELGDSSLSYIQSNYMDGMEGLLAGEKMLYDIKRMEMDYHDLNVREYEMTKQVSLLQVAPLALLQLRATGTCMVSLPEELFDLDGPGHYFRRIKSVAVTIPCVTGPYTGVNCTLALQNSSMRTSPQLPGAGGAASYARTGANDNRFSDYFGAIQAVVTSSAQMDSGLFETNLHDERYLPFEYSGVISQWQLTLPSSPSGVPQFDFDTITDVVLHIRYTAREGGQTMKTAALGNLTAKIGRAQTVGSVRLFSMRHEFPTEWAKFQNAAAPTPAAPALLSFVLLSQHYPYWFQNVSSPAVTQIQLFAQMAPSDNASSVSVFSNSTGAAPPDNLSSSSPYGTLLWGNSHEREIRHSGADGRGQPVL